MGVTRRINFLDHIVRISVCSMLPVGLKDKKDVIIQLTYTYQGFLRPEIEDDDGCAPGVVSFTVDIVINSR